MERKIYKEIPGGKNKFHSAVLTTFSINFHHFESQVLKPLKEKWITSVNILVDQNILNSILGISSNYLKSFNQSYAVNGIHSTGAFHPKINFFIGDSCLLAILGSGNITPGGHGKNHELFSGFYADETNKSELPLLLELWEYINNYASQAEGYSTERICKTIAGCCNLFTSEKCEKHKFYNIEDDLVAALIYNEKGSSIYHQLSNLIPADEINEITIICPYYDRDGALLKNLRKLFYNSQIYVYLQENQGLPPTQIDIDEKISFYDFNKTNRGKITIKEQENDRMQHAKIFHFKSPTKEYFLIGSANATIAAMGSSDSSPLNDELCILYSSSSLNFLDIIGINKIKKPIKNISIFARQEYYEDREISSNSRSKHLIKSIDLENRFLKIYINSKHKLVSHSNLVAFTSDGIECFSFPTNDGQQKILEFLLSKEQLEQFPQYCAFVNASGNIISNKQPINRINELKDTNPEKNLRNIRDIINKIESGQFNEFQIADYLTQLYRENFDVRQMSSQYNNVYGVKETKKTEKDITTLSYDEAIAASNDVFVLSQIASGHLTSRLWQCLENIFDNKMIAISEELMNEEEDGLATESKERKIENSENNNGSKKIGNNTNLPFKIIKKLTDKYCISLKQTQSKGEHAIGIVDYLYFLLCSHTITAICHFYEYTSFPKDFDITTWKRRLYLQYMDSIESILKLLASSFQRRNIKQYTEEQADLEFRHNDLQNKTLYHILLDITIAYNGLRRHVPVVKEQFILYCLNIFEKCGLPDGGLKNYLEKLTLVNRNAFNPQHVLKMLDEIITASKSDSYKKVEKLGICKIENVKGSKYQIKTIYDNGYRFVNKKDIIDFTL